jgi:hypothetical protein
LSGNLTLSAIIVSAMLNTLSTLRFIPLSFSIRMIRETAPVCMDCFYPFFAKVYKRLHAKTDNISGKPYRFPIPKATGTDLGIAQNPGY